MIHQQALPAQPGLGVQLWRLTKPRVNSLIVFTAVIGMFLAVPGLPPLDRVAFATVGIALVPGAAAAFNCLVEQKLDAVIAGRKDWQPLLEVAGTRAWTDAHASILPAVRWRNVLGTRSW